MGLNGPMLYNNYLQYAILDVGEIAMRDSSLLDISICFLITSYIDIGS